MSYHCEISFKQIEPDGIYEFFQKLKAAVGEHMKEIAEDNFTWVPYVRRNATVPEAFSDVPREWRTDAEFWATRALFSFRYFYDKELKLLGVYSIHNCLQDMFDGAVFFQNSCDKNYDKTAWCGISAFDAIFDKWQACPDEEIIEKYNSQNTIPFHKEFDDETAVEHALDYYRKAYCYEEIWARYEHTLYDDDSVVYLALYGFYDTLHLTKFLKMCHERYIEWNKE